VAPGAVAAAKHFRVSVRNADTDPSAAVPNIVLTQTNNCPPGVTVSDPDFDGRSADPQPVTSIEAGRTRAATLLVTADHSITTRNHKTPLRCTIFLNAGFADPTIDANPSNNVAVVEVNLFDKLDPEVATSDETVLRSFLPATLHISKGNVSSTKRLKAVVGNADIVPIAADPGHDISLSLNDNGCGLLSFGSIDLSSSTPGVQGDVVVRGGSSATGIVDATVHSSLLTANRLSPRRCVISLTASGPTNPDDEPTNNVSTMMIDLLDGNDY
jgi:hypothetical protein